MPATTLSSESALRHRATRMGLVLTKSRCRTPESYEYGRFMIIDPTNNAVVAGAWPAFSMDLEDVAAYLDSATD